MPVEVIMPKVDMDMTHGRLATWHVAEGGTVARGQPLFDIETDKAAMEVEAPATGRLCHIAAQPGDRIAVGTTIGWIYAEGEVVADMPPAAPERGRADDRDAPTRPAADTARADDKPAEAAPALAARTRATPAARAAARAAGVALETIPGSGPHGRIQRDDVTAGPAAPAATAGWTPAPGPLHVSRRTGSGPALVMIHGFTADSQSWAPLEKFLPAGLPLIRIDLPGHGRSPRRRIRGFGDLARMLAETFDAATRDQGPVHLLGHSLGGALALAIADIRPRRIASLSLIAPAGLGPEVDAAALAGIVRASRTESLAPWLRRLTAMPDAVDDDYVRAAMAPRRDPALRACQADMAGALFPDAVQAFDLRPALARITAPAQILWGRQDHILPWRHALAADGDFAIHLLAGAGHIAHVECPDRVARIIARLIAAAKAPA